MRNEYEWTRLLKLLKKGRFKESGCLEWTSPHDKDGYGITSFVENGKKKTWKVHRLIYNLLKGDIPENMSICHKCDNPKCYNIFHLFLGSHLDNIQDRIEKGRSRKQSGEKNNMSYISEEKVFLIREDYKNGMKQCEIVRKYGLKQPTVSKILRRLRWTHI